MRDELPRRSQLVDGIMITLAAVEVSTSEAMVTITQQLDGQHVSELTLQYPMRSLDSACRFVEKADEAVFSRASAKLALERQQVAVFEAGLAGQLHYQPTWGDLLPDNNTSSKWSKS